MRVGAGCSVRWAQGAVYRGGRRAQDPPHPMSHQDSLCPRCVVYTDIL